MNMKKRILSVLLFAAILFTFSACAAKDGLSNDIVVLFTNDVHCGIDENIGYAGLSAYKKDMEEKYRYVVLADCGDFTQGGYEAAVSKGEYLIDITNAVGYDFAVIGNHEFDYGMEQIQKNISLSNAQFLNCNLTYRGSGEDWVSKETKPYEIQTFGNSKVAFIGVSTPWSISTSTPSNFMEDGEYVYDFCDESAEKFYENVQKYVDECRKKGADYVIVLSHLGTTVETETPYTSIELIENTSGIDVVLDGHSHTEASCWIRQNKDGEDVLLSSTGTKLANIGKLVLTQDGTASVGYIDNYAKKDDAITKKIEEIRARFEEQMNVVVCHNENDLLCSDENGVRMVRAREVTIGDFVTDAYRIMGEADIGLCNGGAIRADLMSGDITYKDIIAVCPFGNNMCVVKVTGAEILDMLEFFCRHTQSEYVKDGEAYGEDGNFPQISGLKFTVDTSIESTAEADEADAFTEVTGARRISDVMVLKNGEYTPIDVNATYTVSSLDYIIKNGGCGMLNTLADHELVLDDALADYQVLIGYIDKLGGDLSQYKNADGRITVK